MPIYEYKCNICTKNVEIFHRSFSVSVSDKCGNCGGENSLERLISPSCFTLSGNGWYATDFKNKPDSSVENNSNSTDKASDGSKPSNYTERTEKN